MTTPKERYTDRITVIDSRIKELNQANRANLKRVAALEAEHDKEISNGNIDRVDEITEELARLERTMKSRKGSIAALKDPEHPERKKAKAAYIVELDEQAEDIKAEFAGVHQDVLEARAAYIEAARKALPVIKQFFDTDAEKNRVQNPAQLMIPRHDLGGGVDHYEVYKGAILNPDTR